MSSLNQVNLIGNLTADPVVKQTQGGSAVCNFSIATNRSWSDGNGGKMEATEFHSIVAWAHNANFVGKYLKKGSKVYVGGRLETRSWEDKAGVKHYKTEIVAENVRSLDRGDSRPQHQRHPNEVEDVDYDTIEEPAKQTEEDLDDLPF